MVAGEGVTPVTSFMNPSLLHAHEEGKSQVSLFVESVREGEFILEHIFLLVPFSRRLLIWVPQPLTRGISCLCL